MFKQIYLEQYFVVPSVALRVRPSCHSPLICWIQLSAASVVEYVTYALADGP